LVGNYCSPNESISNDRYIHYTLDNTEMCYMVCNGYSQCISCLLLLFYWSRFQNLNNKLILRLIVWATTLNHCCLPYRAISIVPSMFSKLINVIGTLFMCLITQCYKNSDKKNRDTLKYHHVW
jgi:hypothetical protein